MYLLRVMPRYALVPEGDHLQRRRQHVRIDSTAPADRASEGQPCQQALRLFRAMRHHAIVPDVITHRAAVSACEKGTGMPCASWGPMSNVCLRASQCKGEESEKMVLDSKPAQGTCG